MYPTKPIWTAIGSIFLTPILAVLFILTAMLLLICWPFIPVLVYLKERNDELDESMDAFLLDRKGDDQTQPPTP